MKRILLSLSILTICLSLNAQLNVTFKSQVQYSVILSDVWGWANPDDGREYALVGLFNGLNVQDVTDAENPVDLGTVPGPGSIWRDIKTYEGFAYVTNETGGGLLVLDLRNLPAQITEDDYHYWEPQIPNVGTLRTGHNIFIDEFGYGYIPGTNLNSAGVVIIDVFSTPGQPQYVSLGPAVNTHDVYARDNLMYSSEIGIGRFAIYDVSDKQNIQLVGSQFTAAEKTHNAWLSDDSNTLFTTDETSNAPIGSYDVSDPGNIEELDLFRPAATLGDGVIPHNVHVWNDWVIISYYSDGCIILDGSRPTNMVEVGNFDTYIPASSGFDGAWGAYPFLPSQTILVSDQGNGLYILEPDYVRACWLEGNVTDATNGFPLENVEIVIDAPSEINIGFSDGFGKYETGLATSGTYDVTFTKFNYIPVTAEVVLNNGELKLLDIEMEPSVSSYTILGQIIDDLGNPVPQAQVNLTGFEVDEFLLSDDNGNFDITVLEGNYDLVIGAWGYNITQEFLNLDSNAQPVYVIDRGYRDDFVFDFGWEVSGSASTGLWTKGEPNGTNFQNTQANPNADVPFDIGRECYVTGNNGGGPNSDDVDNGNTVLVSPPMDLSNYESVEIRYSRWFFNDGGTGTPNDALTISLSNGTQVIVLETVSNSFATWGLPVGHDIDPATFTLNDNVRLILETSDQAGSDHIVEAAFDFFKVNGEISTSTKNFDENLIVKISPNPFTNILNLEYTFEENYDRAIVQVYNILGQIMESMELSSSAGNITLGEQLDAGIYFIQIAANGKIGKAIKVVKQ